MKNRTAAMMLAIAGVCVASWGSAQVRIMPFGDSITANGSSPESSYRYWLYQDLSKAGFAPGSDFIFVGHQSGVADGAPENSDFDQSYEGGDGWTTSDAVADVGSAAGLNPDIVLLDFGSNDIIEGDDLSQTENNLTQIIQTFAAANPGVVILLAVPTPFAPSSSSLPQEKKLQKSQQSKLTGIIGRVAKTGTQAGIRVIKVNLFSGFSAQKDTKDGAHPNVHGEQKIAKKFFAKLKALL